MTRLLKTAIILPVRQKQTQLNKKIADNRPDNKTAGATTPARPGTARKNSEVRDTGEKIGKQIIETNDKGQSFRPESKSALYPSLAQMPSRAGISVLVELIDQQTKQTKGLTDGD